ncbi:hypothetical protein HYU50_04775 [Candidatus Woesearchaeota archaeon]|nr:hypothetical protein [Candidatus Woesearchaeota archaeon]
MADLNTTVAFLTPYYSTVEQLIGTISLLVGGIFGIYLVILAIRLIYLKKTFEFYKQIKNDMARLEQKIDDIAKKKK